MSEVIRLLLGAVTLGWIAVFGLGSLIGDIRQHGWVSFVVGAAVGALLARWSRRLDVSRAVAKTAARASFVVALLFLTWGLVGLLQGIDPLTGEGVAGRPNLRAEILLLLSAGPACLGLLLLAIRDR